MKAVPKLEESGQKKVNVVRVMVVRMARVMVKVQLSAFQCFIYQPWDGRAAENKIRLMLCSDQRAPLHQHCPHLPGFKISTFLSSRHINMREVSISKISILTFVHSKLNGPDGFDDTKRSVTISKQT